MTSNFMPALNGILMDVCLYQLALSEATLQCYDMVQSAMVYLAGSLSFSGSYFTLMMLTNYTCVSNIRTILPVVWSEAQGISLLIRYASLVFLSWIYISRLLKCVYII
ncbi:hypothetical protein BDQ12DRAFT_672146, partial [Crucibulum laeve]